MSESTEAVRPPRWTPENPHPEPAPIHTRPEKKGENCRVCGRTYENCVGADTMEESFKKRIALNDKVERTIPERIELALETYTNRGGNESTTESEKLADEGHQIYRDKRFREGKREAVLHIVSSVLRTSSFLTLQEKARKLCELILINANETDINVQVNAVLNAITENEKDLPPEGKDTSIDLANCANALAKELAAEPGIVCVGCSDKRLVIYTTTEKKKNELVKKYDDSGYRGFPLLIRKSGKVRPA